MARNGFHNACWAAILLGAVMLMGCNRDYARRLPNGFELVRTNGLTVAIYTPSDDGHPATKKFGHDVIVKPKIISIGISGAIVFGEAVASPQSELPSEPGFFVVDTSAATVETGLDRDSFERKLADLGIVNPKLVDPRDLPNDGT